jgi:hypothetical protein
VNRIIKDEGYLRTIRKFETNFNKHLGTLLELLQKQANLDSDPTFVSLCSRFDYNGFYARALTSGAMPQ